ncbi:MAG: glycosyltransferase [Muribaculaceae bacterium]|nr:glycosyltransferase [Muribaculaceae bacterium]
MKRLLITSTDLMMVQFLAPHVEYLSKRGFDIDVACSEVGGRFCEVEERLRPFVSNIFKVELYRNPLELNNRNGLKELKNIIRTNHYDIIWTNEPVMGVMTRLASKSARKNGTKVLYMAHGFHFYNGAPLLNWLMFYPVERQMAKHADVICTINKEDFNRAKTFNVPKVEYIHGIGINPDRLTINDESYSNIRFELGLKESDFLVLSVGELNRNKNHKTILRAIALLGDSSIHYIICGKGKNEAALREEAEKLEISSNVHFLGYRKDVVNICHDSDLYVMPSFREGLPVSSLEAMYCGLPLVTSDIRGLQDVNMAGRNGLLCKPNDANKFAENIKILKEDKELQNRMRTNNISDVVPFTLNNTLKEVENLLNSILC